MAPSISRTLPARYCCALRSRSADSASCRFMTSRLRRRSVAARTTNQTTPPAAMNMRTRNHHDFQNGGVITTLIDVPASFQTPSLLEPFTWKV